MMTQSIRSCTWKERQYQLNNNTMKHFNFNDALLKTSPGVYAATAAETLRQQNGLELIPSENYVSKAVLEALGSVFTNKYSEGYPGKRYYGGQTYTDAIERAAIDKAKTIFNCKFANVQALSGAPANLAAYFALLEPGDTILGMDLSHGGHLTHGHPMTIASKLFNFIGYKTTDGEVDYEEVRRLALEHKPKLILAGFSSHTRTLNWQKFKEIADEVGAKTMADVAHIAGLIATSLLSNPLDFGFDVMTTTTHKTLRGPRGAMILTNDEELAKKIDKAVFPGLQGGPHMNVIAGIAVALSEAMDPAFMTYTQNVLKNAKAMEKIFKAREMKMVSDGTDNHMIVLDVWNGGKGVTGKDMELALDEIGITVNKNVIPDDDRSALNPSGIRIGTPAITTRGFDEYDCEQVAHAICACYELIQGGKPARFAMHSLRRIVKEIANNRPLPEIYV